MNTILSLKDIYKSYSAEVLFQGFCLDIYENEILGILGPSGCGKSTLIRMIAGLERFQQGELSGGQNSPTVFLIFQTFDQLFPWMTVMENVLYPMKKRRKQIVTDAEALSRQAQHFLDLVEYSEDTGKYPHQLSGGMKQKVALARALAMKPDILLMDEPFASLDEQMRKYMQQLLLRIKKEQPLTILFVTHDVEEATTISDRILLLDKKDNNKGRMLNRSEF